MLPTPDQDIERRRRIWALLADPLIDVALDNGTLDSDFQDIGRVALELGYDDEELRAIYWDEVVPAVTGTWDFGGSGAPGWLEQRILEPSTFGGLLTNVLSPWWIWITEDIWTKIKNGMNIARRCRNEPKKEPFVSLEDLNNDHK